MIRMHAEIDLNYVASENCTYILNVQPASTQRQTIVEEVLELPPHAEHVETSTNEEKTRFVRFTAGPGPVRIRSCFAVELDLRIDAAHDLYEWPASRLPMEMLRYVHPSRYCESEKLMAFASEQFGRMQPGYQRVAAIRDWVRGNVTFRAGTTRWDTAASDIFGQRQGVCRDFAHLMIALCRALNIPARFATGIDYGADPALGPADFHAYVEVFVGGRWYLFDPTGISPTTGLIRLGTGRDAADVAFATIFGNVVSEPPRIAITAVDNQEAGFVLPWHTEHAVSSADDLPTAGTDPQQTFSRRHARPPASRGSPGHEHRCCPRAPCLPIMKALAVGVRSPALSLEWKRSENHERIQIARRPGDRLYGAGHRRLQGQLDGRCAASGSDPARTGWTGRDAAARAGR